MAVSAPNTSDYSKLNVNHSVEGVTVPTAHQAPVPAGARSEEPAPSDDAERAAREFAAERAHTTTRNVGAARDVWISSGEQSRRSLAGGSREEYATENWGDSLMAISMDQRFTRGNPCPICGGFDTLPRGRDKRCAGFMSEDGKWAFCQQVSDDGIEVPIYVITNAGRTVLKGDAA